MVNINIEVPDELHKRVKLSAVLQEKTIKEYIIEQLDKGLRRRKR